MSKLDNKNPDADIGGLGAVAKDIFETYRCLSLRRRRQLIMLAFMQMAAAFSEVLTLGAAIPLFAALADASALMARDDLIEVWAFFGIGSETELIMLLAVGFSITILVVNSIRVLTLWMQTRLAAAIGSDLVADVYRRSLLQPYQFHTNTNSSKLVSQVVYDFNVSVATVMNSMMLTTQGLAIISIISALVVYNPAVALSVGTVTAMAYIFISKLTRRRFVRNSRIISDRYMQMVETLQESYGGIREIVLGAKQSTYIDRFGTLDRPIRRAAADSQFIQATPRYALEVVVVAALSAAAIILMADPGGAKSALPVLGALALAGNRLLPAMQQVFSSISGLRGAHIPLRRTLTALGRPIDPITLADTGRSLEMSGRITLNDVWFRYDGIRPNGADDAWVLRGISLEVPANKIVALVGTTGCGKSTIADLLLGLIEPQRGEIALDDRVMDTEALAAWRRSIAHVPQTVFLSDKSIKENIAFGIPPEDIEMVRVRDAAQQARIADFIESRPRQYDELVGERGIRLSGGQRQRIGIARALYNTATMIVFDEATSALDSATESAVMESIRDLTAHLTVVVIAHRLSTVKSADIVYEIHDGNVQAKGSYDELIATSPSFRALTMTADL